MPSGSALTPRSEPTRRPAYLIAMFVAVTWAAVVFAVYGLLAVGIDRDPVPSGVSPYYGLVALAAAGIVVWIAVARSVLAASPWLPSFTAAAAVYLLLVVSGLADGFGLAVSQATSPFVLVAALLAGATVLAGYHGIRRQRS